MDDSGVCFGTRYAVLYRKCTKGMFFLSPPIRLTYGCIDSYDFLVLEDKKLTLIFFYELFLIFYKVVKFSF